MDFLQPIARYVVHPLLAVRNRRTEMRHLHGVMASQYWPPQALAAWRLQRLRDILIHAGSRCPFYADRFSQCGFDPRSLRSVADLSRIPVLTKQEIQQNQSRLLARGFPAAELVANQTGGSTGAPLQFYVSKDSHYRRHANTIRHNRWAGLQPYHLSAAIWGNARDFVPPPGLRDRLREALVNRHLILDTSAIDELRLAKFVEVLRRWQPRTYVAYAHSAYLLARFIKSREHLRYHRPKSIITSAEVLTEEQRKLIEDVFQCPVFDRYGCREFSVIASECDHHSGLHIAADTLIVEVTREGQPCAVGSVGRLVITDLFNYAMPFIRYRIEDIGRLLPCDCPCGRTLPLMEIVGGRVTDFLVTPEGRLVSGAALTICFIARVPGIAQAQILQRQQNRVTLRIVKTTGFGPRSASDINELIRRFLGPQMLYDIELAEAIPREPSGKYRFTVSELDPLEYLR